MAMVPEIIVSKKMQPAIIGIPDQRAKAVWLGILENVTKHALNPLKRSPWNINAAVPAKNQRGKKHFRDKSVITGRQLPMHAIGENLNVDLSKKLFDAELEPLL